MLSLESSLLVFTEKGKEFSSVCFEVLYLSSKANLLETMYADDTKLQGWDFFCGDSCLFTSYCEIHLSYKVEFAYQLYDNYILSKNLRQHCKMYHYIMFH